MDRPITPTILLVEDDPGICAVLEDALESEGYRVICVHDHDEARVVLGALRVKLVLADTAPGSAADEAIRWAGLERLRDAAGGAPVAIFSAHNPTAFDGYPERGFASLIAKPFDLDELLTTVGDLLGQDQPGDAEETGDVKPTPTITHSDR